MLRNIIAALFYVIVFEMKYVWSDMKHDFLNHKMRWVITIACILASYVMLGLLNSVKGNLWKYSIQVSVVFLTIKENNNSWCIFGQTII